MNTQIRRLEEEVSDLKSAAVTRESDLESALGRLRSVEDQYATLQSEHAKTRNELEISQREYDLLKVLTISKICTSIVNPTKVTQMKSSQIKRFCDQLRE